MKQKIADLKKGSKEWWKLNRELLNRKNKCSSIPPLRQDGEWKKSPYEKANTFAQKFQEKCSLPEEGIDCPFFGKPDVEMDEFVTMRTRRTEKLLRDLDEKRQQVLTVFQQRF